MDEELENDRASAAQVQKEVLLEKERFMKLTREQEENDAKKN